MTRLLLALLLAILPLRLHAEGFQGMSALAAMHPKFPCERYLSIANEFHRPAMTVLWGTFGNDMSCVQAFLDSNALRPHLLQIHMSNEVCRRKNNCKKGELLRHHTVREYNDALRGRRSHAKAIISKRVQSIRDTIKASQNPNTAVILSIGLEDNLESKAVSQLVKIVKDNWPKVKLARNPVSYRASEFGGIKYRELHGLLNLPKPCIANLDGVSIDATRKSSYQPKTSLREFKNYLRRNCDCRATFGWVAEWQGFNGFRSSTVLPPRKRKFVIKKREARKYRRLARKSKTYCK